MKNYKYYYKSDTNKEIVGRVEAEFLNEAIIKAAINKNLSYSKFIELFDVEEITNERNNERNN